MQGPTLDGKYRLIRRVGAGGMGSVYVAERLEDGASVAVKLITSGEHAANRSVVQRFYREAHAAKQINSVHVARVLDVGADPDSNAPYMVMELLEGQDLHRLTKRVGALDPDLMLRISAQACIGLAKAHAAHVVHRDIKSANIFLARSPSGAITVKILDFGIAKAALAPAFDGEESAGLTRTGMLLGSPLFMSPEQTRGTKRIDHRSDIWSLGMVMYRMLTGRAPYEHIRAVGELIFAICSAPPPSVQNVAPWVPAEVAGVLDRVLRLDPGERYQSASDLLADIRALLPKGEGITENMLVGIGDERRAVVAPRFDGGEPMAPPPSMLQPPQSTADPGPGSLGLSATPLSSGRTPAGSTRGQAWQSGPGLQPLPAGPMSARAATLGSGIGAAGSGDPMSPSVAPSTRAGSSIGESTVLGVSNSPSLLDIPAFRPSRTPYILLGGAAAVLLVAVLLQLDAAPAADDGPTSAAPAAAPPPSGAEMTRRVDAATAPSASAAAKPSASAASPGRASRPPRTGGWSPGARYGGPKPTSTQNAAKPDSSATDARPLDPNGFGDRK